MSGDAAPRKRIWSGAGVLLACVLSNPIEGCSRAPSAAARCTSTPTQLVSAKELPPSDATSVSAKMDLAVGDDALYAAINYSTANAPEETALIKIPFGGGAPAVLTTFSGEEQALVLADASAVLAVAGGTASDGRIVRVDLETKIGTVLVSDAIAPASILGTNGGLATDGQNVYYAAAEGTKTVPLAGGAASLLTTHTGSLAIAGSNLTIADSTAEAVVEVALGTGTVTTRAENLRGNVGPLVACGADICWAGEVAVSPSVTGSGTLSRLDSSGALTTLSQGPGLYVVVGLVFDGTDFFATVLADASFGGLVQVPGDGGAPVSIGFGAAIAVDEECLYTADALDGVSSVAKSYTVSR